MTPDRYLLDTGVFYRLGGRSEGTFGLENMVEGLRTTANAPMEILAGMTGACQDYVQRHRALSAFATTCSFARVMTPVSDALVVRAFGRPTQEFAIDALEELAMLALSAESLAKFAASLAKNARATENHRRLGEWLEHSKAYFSEQVNSLTARLRQDLRGRAEAEPAADGISARKAARALLVATSFTPVAWRATILGLAVRAGVISEAAVREASNTKDLARFEALAAEAVKEYDGSLSFFVECYLHYQAMVAVQGGQAIGNDLFDLDQLMFMSDTDTKTVFVTPDSSLADVVASVRPDRVVLYEKWIATNVAARTS